MAGQQEPGHAPDEPDEPEPLRGEIIPAGGRGGELANLPRPTSGGWFRSTWLELARYRAVAMVYNAYANAFDALTGAHRAAARAEVARNESVIERARSLQRLRYLPDILEEDRDAFAHARTLAQKRREQELVQAELTTTQTRRELIEAKADLREARIPRAKREEKTSDGFEGRLHEMKRRLEEEQKLDEWERQRIAEIVTAAGGEDKLDEDAKRRIAAIRSAVGQERTRRARAPGR